MKAISAMRSPLILHIFSISIACAFGAKPWVGFSGPRDRAPNGLIILFLRFFSNLFDEQADGCDALLRAALLRRRRWMFRIATLRRVVPIRDPTHRRLGVRCHPGMGRS